LKQAGEGVLAGIASEISRGFSNFVLTPGVGTATEQKADHFFASPTGGIVKWGGLGVAIGGIDVGAALEQQFGERQLAGEGGIVERCGAGGVEGMGARAGGQQ